ncbi:Type I restriction enzyme R protein N-terminal domain-containing protein [Candidatus Magnetomoraceae bacterium gMMP-15]
MNKSIFKQDKKYTFSDYFEMRNPTEEIVKEFGYSLLVKELNLAINKEIEKGIIERLQNSYYELLPKITINSEIAKREFMIAPLLYEVIRRIDAKLNIEYPIDIDDKLSGSLDYLIRSDQELIIIKAKRGDLDRGFNQLAVQLIALDKYEEYEENESSNFLYGAITIGEVWRFALLNRKEKNIIKDIHTLRFPEDTEEIFGILNGILNP